MSLTVEPKSACCEIIYEICDGGVGDVCAILCAWFVVLGVWGRLFACLFLNFTKGFSFNLLSRDELLPQKVTVIGMAQ